MKISRNKTKVTLNGFLYEISLKYFIAQSALNLKLAFLKNYWAKKFGFIFFFKMQFLKRPKF